MKDATATDPLAQAYGAYDFSLRLRSVVIADVVALVCMPAGILLDYFVYPEMVWQFLKIRLGVDGILLLILLVLAATRNWKNRAIVVAAGVLSTIVVNLSFCLMIFMTEGAQSPYYAGINLVILIMATLLPWKVWETALVCGVSLGSYAIACLANPAFAVADSFSIFFNNSYFIVITTVICVTSTWFRSRARFEDFQLRHQLDVQNRALQDLDRTKTRFFSNVSHELRTPLTLILGPVETLLGRADQLDDRVHQSLILVHRNTLRLLKLINDLLELTRFDQQQDVLRKKSFALGAFVRGVVESVKHLGLAKQIRIKVQAPQPEILVMADPVRMEKVLINLLTNGIKYTPAGGSITVTMTERTGEVELAVSDTGVGIPEEDLPRIFDRFHQVRSNSTNQVQGIGIGLALAREIVQEHEGRIEVESKSGQGSTFRVVLPQPVGALMEATADVDPRPGGNDEPFEKAFRAADRSWRATTDDADLPQIGTGDDVVLVADDEPDMLQYVVSLLSPNYRVIQTHSGTNVAALVAKHEPALVLLDWMMPGKDGVEVCRELRSTGAGDDLKIVLLTARIDEASKLEALGAGADDFLTKPFSSIEVTTRVANLVRSARLQRDVRRRNQELREALAQLKRAEAMLIQSEKMNAIGSLSAGLLHEINNPLNYTLTAIGLVRARQCSLDDDLRDMLADVEEGMIRIRDVITNLKGFAYPEKAGTTSVFPLSEALHTARKLMVGELAGVSIEENLSGPLMIHGHKTQITHLLMNILGNCAKALANQPAGEKRISIHAAETPDQELILRIADSGPGIAPEILDRIFDPFFTTGDVGSGMGMGLSICHTIVTGHGGRIHAANRPTGGAEITIQLPLEQHIP